MRNNTNGKKQANSNRYSFIGLILAVIALLLAFGLFNYRFVASDALLDVVTDLRIKNLNRKNALLDFRYELIDIKDNHRAAYVEDEVHLFDAGAALLDNGFYGITRVKQIPVPRSYNFIHVYRLNAYIANSKEERRIAKFEVVALPPYLAFMISYTFFWILIVIGVLVTAYGRYRNYRQRHAMQIAQDQKGRQKRQPKKQQKAKVTQTRMKTVQTQKKQQKRQPSRQKKKKKKKSVKG